MLAPAMIPVQPLKSTANTDMNVYIATSAACAITLLKITKPLASGTLVKLATWKYSNKKQSINTHK